MSQRTHTKLIHCIFVILASIFACNAHISLSPMGALAGSMTTVTSTSSTPTSTEASFNRPSWLSRNRRNLTSKLMISGGSSDSSSPGVRHVSNLSEYEKLVEEAGDKLVVLDFTASWCMPCRMIAPVFSQLATSEEYGPNALFVKVDVDEAADVAEKFGVMSMPTFVFVKGGAVVDRFSGASVEKLTQTLVANL